MTRCNLVGSLRNFECSDHFANISGPTSKSHRISMIETVRESSFEVNRPPGPSSPNFRPTISMLSYVYNGVLSQFCWSKQTSLPMLSIVCFRVS